MRILFVCLGIMLAVSSCSSALGGFKIGTSYGLCIQGNFDDGRFSGLACPTVAPEGSTPMGSRTYDAAGQLIGENMFSTITTSDGTSATGPAADIVAETARMEQQLLICAVAPQSRACLGRSPSPL